jgi:predicted dehydrogenase
MVKAGVVGVGSMGRHHARVYAELPDVDLVGVADVDADRAREVAREHDTEALSFEALLSAAEAVSVAAPTPHHADLTWRALGDGVHVLVEKPFVDDPATGRELVRRADDRDLVLQVGHVERFNPAIRVLEDVLAGAEVLAVDARRLGPPIDRELGDSVVRDLMIHDLDVVLSLLEGEVESTAAARAAETPHVDATVTFETGVLASLTASRITERRMRRLAVTTEEFRADVDYMTQSVEIHRRSLPEYVETGGDVRYRNETVVERPMVENGEPLKGELESFTAAVRNGDTPLVTGEDGLRALKLANRIDRRATETTPREVTFPSS